MKKEKPKGNFSSYLPREGVDIFHPFSGRNMRIWSDFQIVVSTNTLRWAGEGIPCQAGLLSLSGAGRASWA